MTEIRTVSFNNEVLGKIEDWRRKQHEIPNFSESVNILIQKGLAEGGEKEK